MKQFSETTRVQMPAMVLHFNVNVGNNEQRIDHHR